jgi:hypothetical protein
MMIISAIVADRPDKLLKMDMLTGQWLFKRKLMLLRELLNRKRPLQAASSNKE